MRAVAFSLACFWPYICSKRSGQPSGFMWIKFQAKPSTLDPVGTKFHVLAPTGSLVSQDLGLAWLWTSPIAAGKYDQTSTSVLSQQQTSALSQQQTSVLSQQQTSVLSQQKTSILSQQKTQQQPSSAFITQHQHSASTISIHPISSILAKSSLGWARPFQHRNYW